MQRHRLRARIRVFASATVLVCVSLTPVRAAFAGAIAVSPTRIELSARHPVATLEVRNEGTEAVTVQLERMLWQQTEGRDVYSPDAGLLATPSVFALAPHGAQILRIGVRAGASGERAFRLYAVELPAHAEIAGPGLQMALRIGVPVFTDVRERSSSMTESLVAQSAGESAVSMRNDGAHFTRALALEVRDPAGSMVWETRSASYLLAGGEHRWPVDAKTAARLAQPGMRFSVITESGREDVVSVQKP